VNNEHVKGADELIQKLQATQRYIDNDIPVLIGVEAVSHFKESFVKEGFTDQSMEKWASRKTKRAGSTNSQPILTKTGELADSIDYRIEGTTVIIYSDKQYAQIHNEGGVIAVTDNMRSYFWSQYYLAKDADDTTLMEQFKCMALANEIKIEQRQFIGESEVLNNRIADKITRDLTNLLK
jgi:phage gpG-like protein